MTEKEDLGSQAQGWSVLASIYYNLRQYDDAVKSYHRLIKTADDGGFRLYAGVFYNCGCSLALSGKIDEAFAHVEKSLKMDSARQLSKRMLTTDMDIASLRKDERFKALIEKYFGTKQKAGKNNQKADSQPTSRPHKH